MRIQAVPEPDSKSEVQRTRAAAGRRNRMGWAPAPAGAPVAPWPRAGRLTLDRRGGNMAPSLRLACCIVLLLGCSRVKAQESARTGPRAGNRTEAPTLPRAVGLNCGCCHFCDRPTRQDPCVLSCARHRVPGGDLQLLEQHGLEVIILDELENAYLPVPFDHKGHAEMAEMAQGCVTCHHYTPEGWQHPACKSCHAILAAEADINKPSLLGAYHQQCLNCHREWINERDCDICHRPKAGRHRSDDTAVGPTTDDILSQMHPPIPEPDTEFYRSRSEQSMDGRVIFRHQEHVRRFGLKCVECHHEPSCTRCHRSKREPTPARTLAAHHGPCIQCHKGDMDIPAWDTGRCERCHWRQGQPKPARFEHAETGWPLTKFHQDRSCRDCHREVPFVRLSTDCNDCHGGWSPSVFNHAVTGQVLDENHAGQDCEVCHVERKFDRPPRCDECHDEDDEGIAFPARRPGSRVR